MYKSWQERDTPSGDPVFNCPMWLKTPCCGELLWAFDLRHVDFLESYVAATHRKRLPQQPMPAPIRNGTLASRLPRWMIDSHNRDDVLRGLDRLRERARAASDRR